MSRIVPDKELERIIEILDRVRAAGYPVNLGILGAFDGGDYCRKILSLVESRRDWIATPGFLDAAQKAACLAKASFAIHACRGEAFGIAVAEMALAGCLPFVPASGGCPEVVSNHQDLVYEDDVQAARKIVSLLKNPCRADDLRETVVRLAERFASDRFMSQLRRQVADFPGSGQTAPAANAPMPC